jgi:hypothetical protein
MKKAILIALFASTKADLTLVPDSIMLLALYQGLREHLSDEQIYEIHRRQTDAQE